jgi:hypothetical protein
MQNYFESSLINEVTINKHLFTLRWREAVLLVLLQLEAEQRLTNKPYRTRLTSFYIFSSRNPSLSVCFGGLQTPWIRTPP